VKPEEDYEVMKVKRSLRRMTVLLLIPVMAMAIQVVTTAQETDEGPLSSFTWRQVGPANMSGRVTDVAIPPGGEASTIYVGAAAGGLWKTINNGVTWQQVFQGGQTAAVGDIAIAPSDPNVIYVGMGEPHSRNSISWGDGMYRSTDAGESWQQVGLEYTYHIGRIVVDPRDPMVVYVAALGNLWDRNSGERGLFKSEDGGAHWRKLKGFNDGTGFYDVVLDPENPDVVWATSWERERKAWVFESGGGPNNGIWKSIDAGDTWTRIEGNGLPPSDRNGKSSLEIFPGDPDLIYARIENFADDPDAPQPESGTQQRRPGGRGRGTPNLNGTYMSRDGGESWDRVDRTNGRPFYYCQLRVDPTDSNTIYLIETSAFRVDVDEALKWVDNYERPERDEYRGVTNITGNHHVDFHAMWIDPTNPDHLVVGSDGGVSISWDQGATWDFCDNLLLGQFYAVGFDMARPYSVYGGLQDNGTWGGPSRSMKGNAILNRDWTFYMGGDGFHAQVDPEDPDLILYGESQGGNVNRVNLTTRQSQSIRPRAPRPQQSNLSAEQQRFMPSGSGNISPAPEPGTTYRFNWSSPIILSPHNPRTVFFGGNVLFKSVNRGDTWSVISPDLTTADTTKTNARNRGDMQTGAENHCTIITIGESPVIPGLIWIGTDDGLVHITRDGGVTWTEVTDNFQGVPDHTWVSRVRPSAFEAGRCYVTFDGHRNGDFSTYVYRTDDFGRTWEKLGGGLPSTDPVYVITEDTVNPELVWVGTERGIHISLDHGETWEPFSNNLPIVPVHDLTVHPREHDLIIATHGMGIWIMDNISPLQGLTTGVKEEEFALFNIRDAYSYSSRFEQVSRGDKIFSGANPVDQFRVGYWVGTPAETVELVIESIDGTELRRVEGSGEAGFQMVDIPLRPSFRRGAGGGFQRPAGGAGQMRALGVGSYRLTATCGGETATTIITIHPDPALEGRN